MNLPRNLAAAFFGLVVLMTGVPRSVGGQGIPSEFTNLEIIPGDIEQSELIAIMRDFTQQLGVGRCSYCHTVSDRLDQPTDDFASDERPAKRKARAMLRMVASINGDHLAQMADRSDLGIEVSCVTCHAGRSRPATLAQEMTWALQEGGVSMMEARYDALRERYYGMGAYNFGSRTLEALATALQQQENYDAVMAAVEINLEHYPESAQSWLTKGLAHEGLEQTDEAIAAYERSIELAPRNPVATERLQRLRGGGR